MAQNPEIIKEMIENSSPDRRVSRLGEEFLNELKESSPNLSPTKNPESRRSSKNSGIILETLDD